MRIKTFLYVLAFTNAIAPGIAKGKDHKAMDNRDQTTMRAENKKLLDSMVLFTGQGCPYCDRVLAFLKENNLSIKIKDVRLDAAARDELLKLTNGKKQIPCLQMGKNAYMHESLAIIEKLRSFLPNSD